MGNKNDIGMTYENRLHKLELPSLYHCCERGDMVEC